MTFVEAAEAVLADTRRANEYGPHRLIAAGINLALDWKAIHERLLNLVTTT